LADIKKPTGREREFSNPAVNFGGARSDNHGIVEKANDSGKTLKRLLTYFKDFRMLFVMLVIFVIFSTGAGVAIPALEGRSIDLIHMGSMSELVILVIWLLAMFIIQVVCQLLQTRVSAKLSLSVTRKIRHDLFERIVRLPVSYMDTHSNGDILSRMTSDAENISSVLSQSLTSFVSSVLSITGTLVVIFIYSWQLSLITMVTVFLTVFSTKKLAKVMAKEFRKKAAINGQLNGLTQEMVTGYKSVAAYNNEDRIISEYIDQANNLRRVGIKAESLSNGVGPILDCISNFGFVVVAVFGGIFAFNGMITIGVVSAFIVYAKQFIRPVNEVAQIFGSIQTALAGAERIFSLMDEKTEYDSPAIAEEPVSKGAISFENINFSYTPDTQVIKNLSLEVKPGTKIALVGATGSGKTTLASLLDRFYDVDSGDIKIDGRSIYDMDLASLRSSIAIVLQDTDLFTASIRDNIRYARPDATDAEIEEAARISNCSGFIEALPSGYDTKLVRAGANLSQGQRQLLSIARAVLADPKILVLDEATSSVDTKTEKQIQDAMANLMKNRTSLIIAHRLSTILDADSIIVLDNGVIAETGTFEELMARKGLYYELYMTQFAGQKT